MQVTSFDKNLENSNEHPAGFPTACISKSDHETPGADLWTALLRAAKMGNLLNR